MSEEKGELSSEGRGGAMRDERRRGDLIEVTLGEERRV